MVIRDNKVESIDFNGIYLLHINNVYVAQNEVINAGLVLAKERDALYDWETRWDSGIYADAFVRDSLISLNRVNSRNNLMEWGITVNHGAENNNSANRVYWNHLLGAFKEQKVHVEPNTANISYENDGLERTGNDIWLQILGKGRVMVDEVEYNQSTRIELNEIGTHSIKAMADENSTFMGWAEPIECEGLECMVENTTLLDVVALFKPTEVNQTHYEVELKRDGWNLIGICQNMNVSDINMSLIEEIQSQDGKSIYTGGFRAYSNLEVLEAGYGYWVKGESGTLFNVGTVINTLTKPLQRTGWNLMSSCEERSAESIDMTNITEIQAQNGESIYTSEFSENSNLESLEYGYGYWVEGEEETLFSSK